jgi:hypothetical protein
MAISWIALSGTPGPSRMFTRRSQEATMPFVIRFDDTKRNTMWLRSDYPAVKWGRLADARQYRTRSAAITAAIKLRMKKKLVVEEMA